MVGRWRGEQKIDTNVCDKKRAMDNELEHKTTYNDNKLCKTLLCLL